MKRGLLIVAVVAIMTGVVSARVLRASPGPRRAFPRIETTAQPASSPIPIPAPERAAVVEKRRQPVPILAAARPSTVPLPVDPHTALPKDSPEGKMTEAAAKAAVEADGYKGLRSLERTADGSWRARALRGATEVSLSVDLMGNVSAD